ncbi:MAG: sigma factor, partial [Planctomycetota bacterium]
MDSAAFRELAMQEMDAVYRMAMTLARDPNEASDLVQETYLKAFKAEGRFELREAGVKPWLFKI